AVNCAHLGCPVRWFAQSRLFMCPCHGGAYYEDGSRASGPPPRGLFEYEYQVRDGVLWVRGGQLPTLSGPGGARGGAGGPRRQPADPLEAGVSTRGLGRIRSALGWLEERAGLGEAITPAMEHPVPRTTASWWYVFGRATVALFVRQMWTGICLALVYVPSADGAYQSLLYLNYQAPFGWFLRAVHFWGST